MYIKHKLAVVFFFLSLTAYTQTVQRLYERKLNLGLDDKILVEHHLSQHPANPNHLLLSGMYIHPTDSSEYGCFSAVSTDNGVSWGYLKIFKVPAAADPWAEIMANGTAVYTVLGLSKLYAYRSPDGGINWDKDSVDLGGSHDHEVVLVDEKRQRFFIASVKGNSVYINTSEDFGKNFSFPKTFKFSTVNMNTMTPVMLSDSVVLIPFSTIHRMVIDSTGKLVSRWLKNSLQWVIPYNTNTTSFGAPSLICEECERGFPVMAIDKSGGQFHDRLYYICSNQTNNEILFYYSSTKGVNWSFRKVIKKYSNKPHSLRNRFMGIPQVTVNYKGIVGVVWQDRTDDPNGMCNSLYFSFSSDGGINFSQPYKISTELSCMENDQNFWAKDRYKAGGDYLGFISKPNGNFQITWADSRGGRSQLYIAEILLK